MAKAGPPSFVPYEIFLRSNPQRPRPKPTAATQHSSTKELHPQQKHQSHSLRGGSPLRGNTETGQQLQRGSKPTKASEKEIPTGSSGVGVKGASSQEGRGRGEGRFMQNGRHHAQRPSGDVPPTRSSQGGGGRNQQLSRNERDGVSGGRPATQSAQAQKHAESGGSGRYNHSYQAQGTKAAEKYQHAQSQHNQRGGVLSTREHRPHSQTHQQRYDRGLTSTQGHQTQSDRSYGGVPHPQKTQPQRDMETWDIHPSQNKGKTDRNDRLSRERQHLEGRNVPRQWEQKGRDKGEQGRPKYSQHQTGTSASQTVSNSEGAGHGLPSKDGGTPKSPSSATSEAFNALHKPAQGKPVSIPSFSYQNRKWRNPPEHESVRAERSSLRPHSSSPSVPTNDTSPAPTGSEPRRNIPYTATATQVKKTHDT